MRASARGGKQAPMGPTTRGSPHCCKHLRTRCCLPCCSIRLPPSFPCAGRDQEIPDHTKLDLATNNIKVFNVLDFGAVGDGKTGERWGRSRSGRRQHARARRCVLGMAWCGTVRKGSTQRWHSSPHPALPPATGSHTALLCTPALPLQTAPPRSRRPSMPPPPRPPPPRAWRWCSSQKASPNSPVHRCRCCAVACTQGSAVPPLLPLLAKHQPPLPLGCDQRGLRAVPIRAACRPVCAALKGNFHHKEQRGAARRRGEAERGFRVPWWPAARGRSAVQRGARLSRSGLCEGRPCWDSGHTVPHQPAWHPATRHMCTLIAASSSCQGCCRQTSRPAPTRCPTLYCPPLPQMNKTVIYIPTTLSELKGRSSSWSFSGSFIRWVHLHFFVKAWAGAPGQQAPRHAGKGAPPFCQAQCLLLRPFCAAPAITNLLASHPCLAALWAARWIPQNLPTTWLRSRPTCIAAAAACRRAAWAPTLPRCAPRCAACK